jgi:hypothetical protein
MMILSLEYPNPGPDNLKALGSNFIQNFGGIISPKNLSIYPNRLEEFRPKSQISSEIRLGILMNIQAQKPSHTWVCVEFSLNLYLAYTQ